MVHFGVSVFVNRDSGFAIYSLLAYVANHIGRLMDFRLFDYWLPSTVYWNGWNLFVDCRTLSRSNLYAE